MILVKNNSNLATIVFGAKKLFAVTLMLIGYSAISNPKDAKAEPSCPGTGISCATAPDGTWYLKGEGY